MSYFVIADDLTAETFLRISERRWTRDVELGTRFTTKDACVLAIDTLAPGCKALAVEVLAPKEDPRVPYIGLTL